MAKDFKDLHELKEFFRSKDDVPISLDEQVQSLGEQLNEKIDLKANSKLVFQDRIKYLKEHFPELFGPAVAESIKTQIEQSRESIVNALYPIMGQMIKKYITQEIKVLSEKVDEKMADLFSLEGIKRMIKSWFSGTSPSEEVLASLAEANIEQVFLIEQNTGLLLGSYSIHQKIDEDMVAGMLTAIKSFINDALDQSVNEQIEHIEYNTHKIVVRNLGGYYIAVVVSGITNEAFKKKLDDLIMTFGEKLSKKHLSETAQLDEELLRNDMKSHFELSTRD
ncbi:MAG: hypothetical protein AB8B61_01305 [Cyclobacteriaceae bacterium]